MEAPHIEISSSHGRQARNLGKDPVTIGRHLDNKLVLEDDLVSRHHCVIEPAPEGFLVRDIDSRNGTWLNGKPVKGAALLLAGDVLTVGNTEVRLILPRSAKSGNPDDTRYGGDEYVSLRKKATQLRAAHAESEKMADLIDLRVDLGIPSRSTGIEAGGSPEQVLRHLADSLPQKPFGVGEIVLLNARGEERRATNVNGNGHAPGDAMEAVDLLRLILLVCTRLKATDIHVEPNHDEFQVRLRVDGTIVDVVRLKKTLGTRLVSVVKILSEIDITHKHSVQEGHFASMVPNRRIDYRVSFAPAVNGQTLVIRVLDTANTPLHLRDLNLPDWMYHDLAKAVQQESGMVLVCGPTGSGKSTTLYAVIRDIDISHRNVITIEDPVEIQIEGVNQIPVHEGQGNTFSTLLRSVLRQDPDAILVGEIRDAETARIAMQAAITGQLVFSTVHARNTIGTIIRLIDLGVEHYMVAAGLHHVLAQRLIRQLCQYCKIPVQMNDEQRAQMGKCAENVTTIYAPTGCPRCLGTGYAGRRPIFELLSVDDSLRELILRTHQPTPSDFARVLEGTRFVPLQQTAYELVAQGIAGFDEVERAVSN